MAAEKNFKIGQKSAISANFAANRSQVVENQSATHCRKKYSKITTKKFGQSAKWSHLCSGKRPKKVDFFTKIFIMITRDNAKEVFQELYNKHEQAIIDEDWDKEYMHIRLSISNACHWVDLDNVDYCDKLAQEAHDNGDVFCDVDQFYYLLQELDIYDFQNQ